MQHPEYMLSIAVFALLLFLMSKLRKRRGISYSSTLATQKLPAIWLVADKAPKLLYLALAGILILALASPFQEESISETVIIGKVLVPCIDVSSSMRMELPDGQIKLEVVKKILLNFLKSRHEVDSVGLTAFSGGGDNWGAGVIQYPTLDKNLFTFSAEKIRQEMFGGSTAIGEGIFISLLALSEGDWNKKLRQESNNPNEELDVLRLWSAVNALEIPEANITNQVPRSEDEAIISEVARLTPPEMNKNKVIILFTDGDSNTGLDPIKPIWLAVRLGIKIYYIEVREGSPVAETPDHIKKLREMVALSGGKYFIGSSYSDVERFFEEVSKIEQNEVAVKINRHNRESYQKLLLLALTFLIVWILFETILPIN